MAATRKHNEGHTRRDLLRAGTFALGSALLPHAAAAAPGADDYMEALAGIALALRPRFESGELRGVIEGDGEHGEATPLDLLERECGLRHVGDSMPRAYAVLLASPSEAETFQQGRTDPRYHAARALAHDVLRYARAQGWTRALPGEEPAETPTVERSDAAWQAWGWRLPSTGRGA